MHYLLYDWENLAEKKKAYKMPNVAAELLSVMNDKVLGYFTSPGTNGLLPKLDQLLGFFSQHDTPETLAELNYTRASYVCKVLSALLLEKSGAVASYIFNRRSETFPVIIRCCQSKSVSGLLFSLLTLLAAAQQQPIQMGMAGLQEPKTDAGQLQPELKKETFEPRLDLFKQVIEACIDVQSDSSLTELHANLANIIMIIINKDFPEQPFFMKVLHEKLPAIIDSFCATFPSFCNNKLGNIYLVLLEVLLKDTLQKPAVPGSWPADLSGIAGKYFELVANYFDQPTPNASQSLTPSFSKEIKRLNPKIYKVMEAIIVTLKAQSNQDIFDSSLVAQSHFEKSIFRLFEVYPFNNILHNQLKKFLLILVEKGSTDLLNQYFTDNTEFFGFLERITRNRYIEPAGRAKIKTGYVGHIITLTTAINQRGTQLTDLLSNNPVWTSFITGFYDPEFTQESRALGDIEFHADQPETTDYSFDFTLDEIKQRHAVFLNFTAVEESPENDDQAPVSTPSHPEHPSDVRRGSIERTPEIILKKEIEENMDHELKDLEGESIKSAFHDFNFWKPEIDHNIDDLMSELTLRTKLT